MTFKIIEYTDDYYTEWNDFVSTQPDGWHYHLIGWREVIQKSYHHQCPNLLATNEGRICGILPLTLVKSCLFGRSLTSLPFVDFSGVVAQDASVCNSLVERASVLGKEFEAEYLELRHRRPMAGNFNTDVNKVALVLPLPPDEEQLFRSLPSERRNRINKARKSGLSVEIGGREMLPEYYRIWSENMRDLGSPAHSYAFFENVMRVFSATSCIILVKHEGKWIGAAIALRYREMLSLPWVSSLRKSFDLYPNNILYWEAMRYAIKSGCSAFDFGRSSVNSGTYTFKARWGAIPHPLYWQFRGLGATEFSIPAMDDAKFRLAQAVWKRLPVSLSRIIGPQVRRYITA